MNPKLLSAAIMLTTAVVNIILAYLGVPPTLTCTIAGVGAALHMSKPEISATSTEVVQ